MRPAKNFVVRVALYSVALLYLAADLFLFDGPLNRRIQASRRDSPESIEAAKAKGVVARVLGHSIYLSQVERAARERLWLEGKSIDELSPDQRKVIRFAALNDLIDHQLLRRKAQHNANELPVSDQEIDEAVLRLASRFTNRDEMQAELAAEGIDSEKELRLRLGARIQQLKYLESRIAEGIGVGEEEAREWFEVRAGEFEIPERVRVRHVFLSTLNRNSEVAKAELEQALSKLQSGSESFEALAASISEDERNKRSGGELGWMTRDRLPADFAEPVFDMAVAKPRLLRTKIGWHLVEVLEKKPAEERSFDEARVEVIAALEASKRRVMVKRFRDALRAQEQIAVHVFSEMITGE